MQPQTIKPGQRENLVQRLRVSSYYSLIEADIFLTHPPGNFPTCRPGMMMINDISRTARVTATDADPLAGIHGERIIYYPSNNQTVLEHQELLARELSDYLV